MGFSCENQSYITCLWFSEWFPVKSGSNLGVLYTQKLLVATHEVGNRPTSSNQRQTASWFFCLGWLLGIQPRLSIHIVIIGWPTRVTVDSCLTDVPYLLILIIYCMYNHSEFIRPLFFRLKNGVFNSVFPWPDHDPWLCWIQASLWVPDQYRPGDCPQKYKSNLTVTVQLNEINLVVKSALRDLDVARIVVCSFPMHPRFFWGPKTRWNPNCLLLQITSLHAQPASHVIEKPGDDLSTAFGADEFLQCHVAAPATCRFWAEVMWVITGWWFWTCFFSHMLGMSSSQLTFIFFRG